MFEYFQLKIFGIGILVYIQGILVQNPQHIKDKQLNC